MFYSVINSRVSSAVGKMRTRFIRTQTGLSENILCCEHRAPDQAGSSMDALALNHLLNRLMNWNPRLLTTKTSSLCILLCASVYVHERRKRFDEFCVSHFFSQCAQSVSLPKTRHYILYFHGVQFKSHGQVGRLGIIIIIRYRITGDITIIRASSTREEEYKKISPKNTPRKNLQSLLYLLFVRIASFVFYKSKCIYFYYCILQNMSTAYNII